MKARKTIWERLRSLAYNHIFVGFFAFPAVMFGVLAVFWIKDMYIWGDYDYVVNLWEHLFEFAFAMFFILETVFLGYLALFTSINAFKKFRR